MQGMVTSVDSVVTTAISVDQWWVWSMVKAPLETWSMLTMAGRSAEWMDVYTRTTVCSLSLASFSVDLKQVAGFREVLQAIDGQTCTVVKVQQLKISAVSGQIAETSWLKLRSTGAVAVAVAVATTGE
jgi:hypothetical protein